MHGALITFFMVTVLATTGSGAGGAVAAARADAAAPGDTLCLPRVVPCNYAHLYSGTFSWRSNLAGEWGSYDRSVTVRVVQGVATCRGGETEVNISEVQGQKVRTTELGTIQGPGLIAVEFDYDESGALVYRVTGACPSPVWRPSRQLPVQPAALGTSYEEQSYNQPATAIGINLSGSRDEPAPETDLANGVSGRVLVTWELKRQ